MKAAVVHAKGDLRLEERPIPDVPEASIRIKVEACAICGTDLRIYRKGDYRASYPVIVGHEIAGIIDAVSPGVTSVSATSNASTINAVSSGLTNTTQGVLNAAGVITCQPSG